MAYFKPFVDSAGLHIPTYIDIRDDLISQCKNIYGQDLYLEEDSMDYQWIAINAEKIYDAFLAAQLAYNNRGPGTAIESGLDGIVKVNGIKRKSAKYSTCHANITGIPGAIISNGIAVDKGNIKWDLPTSIIVSSSGVAENLLLTCEVAGPIAAAPGDIVQIFNPQYGWTAITNIDNAELGSYIENDAELRVRQQTSTAQPSQTVLTGIEGAIAQIKGVTRYKVYENDTKVVDSNGLPPNSITCVVEGGDDQSIAQVLYIRKTPGGYTNGTTEVELKDSNGNLIYNALNQVEKRRFYKPTYVDVDLTINIKALKGYTSQNTEDIKSNSESYLNSLDIGTGLPLSSIWGVALSSMSDLKNPTFSITSVMAAKHGQSQSTDDIPIAFSEVVRGSIDNITVNVT